MTTLLSVDEMTNFEIGAFRSATAVYEGLVAAFMKSEEGLDPHFIRAITAAALVSVALGEYQRNGFTLEETQKQLAEQWKKNDAGERRST